jgi:hypothetical protein
MPWTWLNKVIKIQSIFNLSVIEKGLLIQTQQAFLT